MLLAEVAAKMRDQLRAGRARHMPPVNPSKHRKRLAGTSRTALATGRRPATVKAERRKRRKMRTATRRAQRAHNR
jgi:hypothetical protein